MCGLLLELLYLLGGDGAAEVQISISSTTEVSFNSALYTMGVEVIPNPLLIMNVLDLTLTCYVFLQQILRHHILHLVDWLQEVHNLCNIINRLFCLLFSTNYLYSSVLLRCTSNVRTAYRKYHYFHVMYRSIFLICW